MREQQRRRGSAQPASLSSLSKPERQGSRQDRNWLARRRARAATHLGDRCCRPVAVLRPARRPKKLPSRSEVPLAQLRIEMPALDRPRHTAPRTHHPLSTSNTAPSMPARRPPSGSPDAWPRRSNTLRAPEAGETNARPRGPAGSRPSTACRYRLRCVSWSGLSSYWSGRSSLAVSSTSTGSTGGVRLF